MSIQQKWFFNQSILLRLNLFSYRYMFRSSWGHHQAVLYNMTKVNRTPNMEQYFGAIHPYYKSYTLSYNMSIINVVKLLAVFKAFVFKNISK
jgi:hypothetical protein